MGDKIIYKGLIGPLNKYMKKISEKMTMFCEEYVKNGYNGLQAYKEAYKQGNDNVCKAEAYKLLRDQRVLDEIERVEGSFRVLGHTQGLDKKTIISVLVDMLQATKLNATKDIVPDYTARKDAILLFGKLAGDFKEKKEVEFKDDKKTEVDLDSLSEEDLDKLRKELITDL